MSDEPQPVDQAAQPEARPRHARHRSSARLAAVQALFQAAERGLDAQSVVDEFRSHRLSAAEIDALIDAVLPAGWPRHRIDPVVRAILRAGCFELLARDDVPARVVVDEYVSLARAFFEGGDLGFVNANLDALARRVRPQDFAAGHADAAPG